jgi:hypothetical protein
MVQTRVTEKIFESKPEESVRAQIQVVEDVENDL